MKSRFECFDFTKLQENLVIFRPPRGTAYWVRPRLALQDLDGGAPWGTELGQHWRLPKLLGTTAESAMRNSSSLLPVGKNKWIPVLRMYVSHL